MVKRNIVAIIQARINSSRFNGKVLKKIKGKSILEIIVSRLRNSKNLSNIVVATSKNKNDKKIIDLCNKIKIDSFQGSEFNVLKRYYDAAKKYNAKHIVRITADCPFVDPSILDKMIDEYFKIKVDYLSNINPPSFPDGLDIEIFSFETLEKVFFDVKDKFQKEHVTQKIILNDLFIKKNFYSKQNYSSLRLTFDTKLDFLLIKKIFKKQNYNFNCTYKDIIKLYKENKKEFSINKKSIRNEKSYFSLGQKTWEKAKNIMPGGTMLFSKNPDLYLPKKWPAYFSKAKKCSIWDLNGTKHDDVFLMGVGTNVLGYANKKNDEKVKKVISSGNMSSLNSVDEINLAEKIIDIHPWSEMARFTRTGGEANAVAIRIARAYTGKDGVAVCGYHGWHDWYLSSNLSNKESLNNHLMSNLPIKGVPRNLKNSVFSFEYNDLKALKKIVETKNVGIIKMEVERDEKPRDNFLKKVRDLAIKKNIILIFDECTSGFRSNLGGLHLKYKVTPDIAILGKALGNGYAINAIIGKREIMQAARDTFISSTFWTERIGPTAALETLKIMENTKSWNKISNIGAKIKSNWKKISKENSLKIEIKGLDALPKFFFNSKKHNLYKTFITQEMLKNKILASNVVYTSVFHNQKMLEKYFEILNNSFKKLRDFENERANIFNYLEVPQSIKGLRDKT